MVFDYFESSLGLKNEGILKNIKDRIFSHGVGFSSEKSKQPAAAVATFATLRWLVSVCWFLLF